MPSCKVLKKWQMTSCHGSERYQSLTHGVFSLKFDQQQIILGLDRPFSYAPQCFMFDTRSRQLSVWVPELHGKLLGARNQHRVWCSNSAIDLPGQAQQKRRLTLSLYGGYQVFPTTYLCSWIQYKASTNQAFLCCYYFYLTCNVSEHKSRQPSTFNVFFYYCIDKTDVRVCGKSICFIKVLVSEIQSSFIIGRGDALLLLSLWICWTLKNLITC